MITPYTIQNFSKFKIFFTSFIGNNIFYNDSGLECIRVISSIDYYDGRLILNFNDSSKISFFLNDGLIYTSNHEHQIQKPVTGGSSRFFVKRGDDYHPLFSENLYPELNYFSIKYKGWFKTKKFLEIDLKKLRHNFNVFCSENGDNITGENFIKYITSPLFVECPETAQFIRDSMTNWLTTYEFYSNVEYLFSIYINKLIKLNIPYSDGKVEWDKKITIQLK